MTLRQIWAKPGDDDRWIWGVTEGQARLIQAGYACGNCLEEYKLNGERVYMAVCPVCKTESSRETVPLPEDWREYMERRATAEGQ